VIVSLVANNCNQLSEKMNDIPEYPEMLYPETPLNLPDSKQAPEYGSDIIADVLSSLGFEHVFIVPGSSFRGLQDSLVNYTRNKKPEIILCTTETIAVAMAHGYAKSTGKPALCIIHDLVGLMLGSMAVYNAYCDRSPVMILGGSGPLDPAQRRYIDWVHSANTQSDLVKPFTKWTSEPPTLQATVNALLKGHKITASKPGGPIYISIDQGVQEDGIPDDLVIPSPELPHFQPAAPMAPNPDQLDRAADMLLAAEMPLIIAGRFGIDAKVTPIVQKLVEITGAAYVDDRSIVCMPTDHPQNLSGDTDIRRTADVVLAIDCIDPTNAVAAYNEAELGRDGQKLIVMSMENIIPKKWSNFGTLESAVEIELSCDPLLGTEILTAVIEQKLSDTSTIESRKAALAEQHDALRKSQAEDWLADKDASPIKISHVIHELHEVVKDKPWFLPVRNHRSFTEGLWQFDGAGHYLGSDGGGGVGYGPGAAIGASLARNKKGQINIAIMGDGDFVMSASAIWTAVHYQVPLLIVINNNNSWGNDEHHQIRVARARNRPPENAWIGQRMIDPDIEFATVSKGFGAWAEGPVTDPNALTDVFAEAVKQVEQGNVAVVDVRTAL
jgi:acetolactate synthase I/II/III large subunit